mmetsp:Transcript_12888/g.17264  ORF Transcript_12888/g.17264 Transcript_12888/m.17264 type:complete len:328 (+) Transcript_12888:64-1047(+)
MADVIDLCGDSDDDDGVIVIETKPKRKEMVTKSGPQQEQQQQQQQRMMPGEAEALENNKIKSWKIKPSRNSDDTDPGEYHYRICESQWNRTLGSYRAIYELESIEYYVNPALRRRFEKKKAEYNEKFGEQGNIKILGFHGTGSNNVQGIVQEGFKLSKVGSSTDPGWYGKGVYFSEYAHVSLAYCKGAMLLCRVLLGKPYPMSNVKVGAKLQAGYTSHINNNNGVANGIGTEVVIFDEAAILPIYQLQFTRTAQNIPTPAIAMPTMTQAIAAGKQATATQPPKQQKEEPQYRRPRKRPVNSVRHLDGSSTASALNDYFKLMKKRAKK